MNSLLKGIRFLRPTICSHFHMIHFMPTTTTTLSKVLPGTYNQRLRTYNPTKTSWPELVGVEGTYNQCLRRYKSTINTIWSEDEENTIWPEIVGLTAEEAMMKIKGEINWPNVVDIERKINWPNVDIIVVPDNSCVTYPLRRMRVRLFVNESNNVVRIAIDKPAYTIWPDLVGLTAEEAKREIKCPRAQVVPHGHHVTCDYKVGRVRMFVDESKKVVRIKKG